MTISFSTSIPLSKAFLKDCFESGLLAGPEENETQFCGRIHSQELLRKLFPLTSLPIVYSNRSLKIWEGAVTWKGPASAILPKFLSEFPQELQNEEITLIQLNKNFQKGRFLGYSLEEVLEHEKVHLMRSAFSETLFEEYLAYQTSPSFIRKFFGACFLSTWEMLIFMGALMACPLHFVAGIVFALTAVFFLGRLTYIHRSFARCLSCLQKVLDEKEARNLAKSLTDKEILQFAKSTKEDILEYGRAQTSLRWEQLRAVYSVFL